MILFFLFFVVPIADLVFLVHLAGRLGFWFTLGLVIFTGVVGISCVKSQGRRVLERLQGDLAAGRMPAAAALDGVLLLAAGLLLITPGVFTDAAGLLLLVPQLRRLLGNLLAKHFAKRVHFVHYHSPRGNVPDMDGVIEGDWEEEKNEK